MGKGIDPRQMSFVLAERKPVGRPSRYKAVLAFMRAEHALTGRVPSYGRICAVLGVFDRSTVRRYVVMGERRGDMVRSVDGLRLAS